MLQALGPVRTQRVALCLVCSPSCVLLGDKRLCLLLLRYRTPRPEHLQVPHGDVSVPTGGAASQHVAELPAGRGGGLPEQGMVLRHHPEPHPELTMRLTLNLTLSSP